MDKERKQILDMLISKQHDNCLRAVITRVTRNSAESDNMRKIGNDQFNKGFHDTKSHENAWRFYTISIAAAEPESEGLALAYGNRSAILTHLSKYEESIIDIHRALKITKNNSLRIKLLMRKAKCLYFLDSSECHNVLKKAEFLVNQVTNQSVKEAFEDGVEKTRDLLKKQNKSVPKKIDKQPRILDALMKKHQVNDFSAVKIQFNERYGRHLVAAKDIQPGDVIFVEKPFIRCSNLGNMHSFCSHCSSVCWTNISCDNCSWAMFCSEKCKQEAWKEYHDIECSIYACAKQKGNGTPQQLALKAIIMGIKEYGNLENMRTALNYFDENTDINKGFLQGGKIQPNGLLAMYSLSRDISKKSLKKHEEETAKTLKSVGLNTDWFGSNFDHSKPDSYRENESAILFGTLFLIFSKIGQINGRQMWNHRNNPCHSNPGVMICPPKEECCGAGPYLALVTSLLNHSCFPNARVCYAANNSVIVYATQPIKKGEQIFDCYSLQFHEEDMARRQKILSRTYNIKCDCVACEKKWPFAEDFQDLCERKLKNHPLENQLFQKNQKVIMSTCACCEKTKYDEKAIGNLRKDIEKAVKNIPQPSFTTVTLMHTMQKVYEALYGITLYVPSECNNI